MLSPEPTERDLKWLEEDYCADIRVMGLIEHYRDFTARLGRCENNLIDEKCRNSHLLELAQRCSRLEAALENIQGSYYLLCCQEIAAAAFDDVMMEEKAALTKEPL